MAAWHLAQGHLERLGLQFTVHVTREPGEATIVTRQALRDGTLRVVAVGGDGTLNEVIGGYFDESGSAINREAAVGILPSGTGSDFSRTLGLTTLGQAVDILIRDSSLSTDVVKMTFGDVPGESRVRYFINVASFGLGGETVTRVNARQKGWPDWVGGKPRFVLAALYSLWKYSNRPVTVILDAGNEELFQTNLVLVANGQYAGSGMKFAPRAAIDDGLLDVVVTDGVGRFGIVWEMTRIWDGGHLRNPKIVSRRARRISIASQPEMPIDLDGDIAGTTPVKIEILPGAIRLIR